jgi:KaiC/GvpD/RAD55 family RecA-like ATPase
MCERRQSTGVPGLDGLLGGGLIPGTLTVVLGATGAGKTQLGVQYAHAGLAQEGRRGVLFDLSSRGDSQGHRAYARRICQWELQPADGLPHGAELYALQTQLGDYLHLFGCTGRRVTRGDLDPEAWHAWQVELGRKLQTALAFLYGSFVRGVRRVVVDGVEPSARAADSAQLELFEYLYHQVLRKEAQWVARDVLREQYRRHAALAEAHTYAQEALGCLLLYTTAETMLEDLLARRLEEGDVLTNANTIICLGRVRTARGLGRALCVAKHRGSRASDEIVPFTIGDDGLRVDA